MSYIKLPTDLMDSPPMQAVSNRAMFLFIAGICHCSRKLTDGHISWAAMRKLPRFTPHAASQLVQINAWEETPDGVFCPWFLRWNPERDRSYVEQLANADRTYSQHPYTKRRLVAKWGNACAYCEAPGPGLHVEHIVPLCRGGADAWGNLTLA